MAPCSKAILPGGGALKSWYGDLHSASDIAVHDTFFKRVGICRYSSQVLTGLQVSGWMRRLPKIRGPPNKEYSMLGSIMPTPQFLETTMSSFATDRDAQLQEETLNLKPWQEDPANESKARDPVQCLAFRIESHIESKQPCTQLQGDRGLRV